MAFSSVGMFSAIGGLGAGGAQDVQLVDVSNSVLYGTFCIMGFFAGSINVGVVSHNLGFAAPGFSSPTVP